jgi:hypothetical protein
LEQRRWCLCRGGRDFPRTHDTGPSRALVALHIITTLREIADALNARGVPTARGGRWYAMTVSNVLERAYVDL